MSPKLLVILNACSLVFTLFLNFLAATGKLSGANVGEVSGNFQHLLTPAPYAFSIWSVIYILLIGFVGFQIRALYKVEDRQYIQQTGLLFLFSNLLNSAWLIFWTNYQIGSSVLIMLLLLTVLIALTIKLRLEIWQAPLRVIVFVWWPFAVYLGWIVAATVANVSAYFVYKEVILAPETSAFVAVTVLAFATAIYLFLLVKRNLRESNIVGVWAFTAIAVAQNNGSTLVFYASLFFAVILFSASAYHGFKNRKENIFWKKTITKT